MATTATFQLDQGGKPVVIDLVHNRIGENTWSTASGDSSVLNGVTDGKWIFSAPGKNLTLFGPDAGQAAHFTQIAMVESLISHPFSNLNAGDSGDGTNSVKAPFTWTFKNAV